MVFLAKAYNPTRPWEELQAVPTCGMFYKISDQVLLKTVKAIKNKEDPIICDSQKEPKETTQCSMLSWVGSWNRKRALGEN